jgi:uncharacterized small protein (DUF1192 family)
MMKRIGELKAENERLRMEQKLKAVPVEAQLLDRVAALKAEVERVGAENSHLHKGIYSLSLNVGQLKDEVERLTKAGDAMADDLPPFGSKLDWIAAKGVQR